MPPRATSMTFADAARLLAAECRARGLLTPAFRSPPALAAAERTLRRRPDGGAVVAVRVRGRPLPSVVADLVEGVVAANGLSGEEADALRQQLLRAMELALGARAA